MKHMRRARERGAVLVLFAFVAVASLGLMALIIDGSFMRLSVEEAQFHSRLAVLAAIEEYFNDSHCEASGCSHASRLSAALHRAQEIAGLNVLSVNRNVRADLENSGVANKGFLEAGRWETDAQKCGSIQQKPPCFLPLDSAQPGQRPNAFRVSGNYYSGVGSWLAQLVGFGRYSTKVYATATVTPRRLCFLVDVSGSTVYITHPKPDHYAYHMSGGEVIEDEREDWDRLQLPESSRSALDYKKKAMLIDSHYDELPPDVSEHHPKPEDYPAGDEERWVYVDTVTNPEPLGTIFFGIQQALATLKARAVSGDKACLIVYDNTLTWPRIVKITDDFDYLLELTNIENNAAVADDTSAAQALNYSSSFERSIRHGFFPSESSFTDSYLAVREALSQFVNDTQTGTGIPSADSIVMLTDGLTNCTRNWEDELGDIFSPYVCSHDIHTHRRSVAELRKFAISSLAPAAVAVHIMLVGADVRPHTLNIASDSDPNRCMTDREYRAKHAQHQQAIGFVKGEGCNKPISEYDQACYAPSQSYPNAPGKGPYYTANSEMYEIAALTQGVWAPLRPPPDNCVENTYQAPCIPGERQETDPKCRSLRTQVTDYMKEILGENPYTLVELEARGFETDSN